MTNESKQTERGINMNESLKSMLLKLEIGIKSIDDGEHDLLDYELQKLGESLGEDFENLSVIVKQVRIILDHLVTK